MEERLPGIGDAKVCCTCKQLKPLDGFNVMRRAPDGRQASCRECNKAYHYANWARHMAQVRARKVWRVAENRRLILEYLLEHPCTDCGETDLVVLEFDHLRDKRDAISSLVGRGYEWAYILEEIERCEVVCANCHRRRTARRSNSYRWQAAMDRSWAARESDPDQTN